MTRLLTWCVVATAAAMVTGCADAERRLSPTSPSSVVIAESPGEGASSAAWARAASWASQHGWSAASQQVSADMNSFEVEGTDTITALSGHCPDAVLTMRGVPVTLNASTTFAAPLSCAALAVGTVVKVKALLTYSGSAFTVTARRLEPVGAESHDVEVEGMVASVSGACPSLTITDHAGRTVVTDASTVFEPTGACARVAAGVRFEAEGPRTGSQQMLARKFEVKESSGSGRGRRVDGEGVIGAISGACPSLTMVVRGHHVQTTAETQYVNGSCQTLRPGTQVKVDADVRPDNSIYAVSIEVLRTPGHGNGEDEVEVEGVVASVAGTCPALTVTDRGGRTIVTNAMTAFEPAGACARVAAGKKFEAKGTRNDSGQFVARKFEVEGDAGQGRGRKVDGEGVIGAVSGSCPALTLSLRGHRVQTSGATVYEGGSCQMLKAGMRVKIDAEVSPDGRVFAESIKVLKAKDDDDDDDPAGGAGN